MANNIIQLVIAAKNEASGTIKTVQQDLNKLNSISKSGTTGGTGGTGLLAGYGTPAAILAFGTAVAFAAKQASESAAQFERLKVGTDSLGQQYGLSAATIISSIDSITQGTLSQSAILQQANQAMLLGVADTAEEFETLAKIAVDRGRKMGIDMEKAFSSIVLGVGRLSPLILDNLGIVIDADNTYKAYAETIGKTAATLTDMEKRQALLARLTDEMSNFDAGGVLDAASAWERLSTAFTDSTVVVGDFINKSTPFIAFINDLATNLQVNALTIFGNDEIDQLKLINIQLAEAQKAAKGVEEALAKPVGEPNAYAKFFGLDVGGANDKFRNGLLAQQEEIGNRILELEAKKKAILDASVATVKDMTAAEQALAEAKSQQAADEANAAIQQEKLNGLMSDYGKQMGLTKTEIAQMTDGLLASEGSLAGAIAKAQQLTGALSAAAAQAAAVSSAMGGAFSSLQSAAVEAYRNSGYDPAIIQSYNTQLGYLENIERTLVESGVAERELAFYAAEAGDIAKSSFDDYNKQFEAISKSGGGAKQLTAEFSSLKSIVSGLFSDMYSDIGGVKMEDFMPREDAPNEAARRIADVMVKGFESPWASYFESEFPILFKEYMGRSGGDIKSAAGLLLKDFQSGLRPELINVDVIKELAKKAFRLDQSTKSMIEQVSRELAAELGISIEEATGYASGAAGGAGLISKEAITKTNSELKFKPEFDMSNTKNDLISAGKTAGLLDEAGQILIEAAVKITNVNIDTSTLGVIGIPTVPIVTGTPTTNAQKVLDMIGTVSAPVYLDYTKINGSPTASENIVGLIGNVEAPVYLGIPTTTSIETWKQQIMSQTGSVGIPISVTAPALETVGAAFAPVYWEIHNTIVGSMGFTGSMIITKIGEALTEQTTNIQLLGLNLGINMYQGFAQYPLGAVLAGELSRQVDEAQKSFENSGKNAGRKWGEAFLGVVGENVPIELLNILTDLITPEVQARLASEGSR